MTALLMALSLALVDKNVADKNASVEDAAAKKLYEASKKKVLDAKAFKIAVDANFKGKTRSGTMKGTIIVASGNKVRVELTMTFGNRANELKMVCDGKKMASTSRGKTRTQDVEKDFAAKIRDAIVRIGPTASVTRGSGRPVQPHKLSGFALGGKETIAKRQAQIIKYNLTQGDEVLNITAWIDAKTKLPLKRVVTREGRDGKVTESTAFTLNPKLDAKTFKLPE